MQSASARKQTPTTRKLSRSARSRSDSLMSAYSRHNNIPPDVTSITLSNPKPTKAMLPAKSPATMATTPSRLLYAIVKYSSFRPCFTRWARLVRPVTIASTACRLTRTHPPQTPKPAPKQNPPEHRSNPRPTCENDSRLLPKLPDLVANRLKALDELVLALHPFPRETQLENEHVRL